MKSGIDYDSKPPHYKMRPSKHAEISQAIQIFERKWDNKKRNRRRLFLVSQVISVLAILLLVIAVGNLEALDQINGMNKTGGQHFIVQSNPGKEVEGMTVENYAVGTFRGRKYTVYAGLKQETKHAAIYIIEEKTNGKKVPTRFSFSVNKPVRIEKIRDGIISFSVNGSHIVYELENKSISVGKELLPY